MSNKYYYRSGEEIQIGDVVYISMFNFDMAVVETITLSPVYPISISHKNITSDLPVRPNEITLIRRKEWLSWV